MHANKYKASLSRGSGNQGGSSSQRPELARVYFASRARQDAGRGAAAHRGRSVRPGIRERQKLWGRRGIIGGYWGGYNSLSSSPTPRALPGKVENLTPPANGKTATPQPCRISSRPAPTTQAQSDTRTTCAAALGFFFSPWTRSTRAACQMMPRRLRTLHHLRRPDDDHDGQQQTSTTRRPDDAATLHRLHQITTTAGRTTCAHLPAAYSSRPRRLPPAPCSTCAAPMMTAAASRSAPPRPCNGQPPEGSDSPPNGI